jgi:hypothetical protein
MAGSPTAAAEFTVPVDVGVGPAFYHGSGALFRGSSGAQVLGHYGLKVSLAAIISQEMIKANLHRVPKRYRGMASRMKGLRYRPSIFIPDALIISPKVQGTGMYGVTWRPIGINVPLYQGPANVSLGAGALLTAAFIHSDVMTVDSMFFLRPGLDLGAQVEIPFTDNFLMSFGWNWQVYIPQIVGGNFLETTFSGPGLDNAVWNVAQAFIKFHVRFPYTANL